jgi:hypothetical protein
MSVSRKVRVFARASKEWLIPFRHIGFGSVDRHGGSRTPPGWYIRRLRIEPAYPKRPAWLMEPLRASPFWAEDAQSMRQDERKSFLLLEWDRWLQTQPDPSRPTARDTLKFFCELQDRRSPLLDFRSGGRDKWQIIRAWLQSGGRLSEGVSLARSSRRRERATSQTRPTPNNKQGGKPGPRRGRRADTTRCD